MTPFYQENWWPTPDKAFQELLSLDWLDVTEARREYFMSQTPRSYIYGKGKGEREYHSKEFNGIVAKIMSELNGNKAAQYNVCFLNRYDSQKHQLGWHADDSPNMDLEHSIAVVSFGEIREIWWRLQTASGVVPLENRQKLGNGSLFIMPGGFQSLYHHRIPKSDRVCGTRISLTFRKYV